MTARPAALALAIATALGGCGDDWVVVRLTGADGELALTSVSVAATVAGGGRRQRVAYDGDFRAGASDFVVVLGEGAGEQLDLSALVSSASRAWAGDMRIRLPGARRTVELALSPSDVPLGLARYLGTETRAAAAYGSGLLFAWPDVDGVSARVERDLDRLGQRAQRVAPEPNASSVRACARPSTPGGTVDLAAVAWHAENGDLGVRTFVPGVEPPTVTVGQGADVHPACLPAGSRFDVATLAPERGQVWASFLGADGRDVGGAVPPARVPLRVGDTTFTARRIVGVVPGPDSTLVVAVRGTFAADKGRESTVLARVRSDGAAVADARPAGDVRALARGADGDRVLIAAIGASAPDALEIASYEASSLAPVGAPARVADARNLTDAAGFDAIGLADCAVLWPEVRKDGTGSIELRYAYLDAAGRPLAAEGRRVGGALDGDAFMGTPVCLGAEVAWAAFVVRTDPSAITAQLRVRRLPFVRDTAREGASP